MNLEIPDIIWSCWDNGAPQGLSIMFKSRSEYRKRYFTNFFADPEFDQNYLNWTQISSNIYFAKLRQVFWNVYQKSLTVLNYPQVYIHNLEIKVFETFYTLCGKEDKQVPGCGSSGEPVYKKEEWARAKLLRLLLSLSLTLRLPLNCHLQVKSKQPKDFLTLV